MGATANGVKQNWNQAHYTQVKISVSPELASSFKDKCRACGVSMAAELSSFMRETVSGSAAKKGRQDNLYATRPLRRKALLNLMEQVSDICCAEQSYMDNIPENLRGSRFYEAAEETVAALEDALEALSQAY
jgi:hypothetical protein